MSDEIDIIFRSNAAQVTPAVDKLAAATDKVSHSAEKQAAVMSEKVSPAMRGMATAATRMGGPIGQVAGAFGKATPLLIGVGVAAVAVHAAFTLATGTLERHKQIVGEVEARHQALSDTMRKAREEAGNIGLGAVKSQGSAQRQLIAAGGDASAQSQTLGKSYPGASEAVAASLAISDPAMRATAVEAAKKLFNITGAALADSIKDIAKNGGIFTGDASSTAGYALGRSRNQMITGGDIDTMEARVNGSATGRVLNEAGAVMGQTEGAALARLPEAIGALRTQLAATRDPLTAALLDFTRQQQAQEGQMKAVADSMGKIATAFDYIVNFRDAAQNKLRVEQKINSAAVFAPDS